MLNGVVTCVATIRFNFCGLLSAADASLTVYNQFFGFRIKSYYEHASSSASTSAERQPGGSVEESNDAGA